MGPDIAGLKCRDFTSNELGNVGDVPGFNLKSQNNSQDFSWILPGYSAGL